MPLRGKRVSNLSSTYGKDVSLKRQLRLDQLAIAEEAKASRVNNHYNSSKKQRKYASDFASNQRKNSLHDALKAEIFRNGEGRGLLLRRNYLTGKVISGIDADHIERRSFRRGSLNKKLFKLVPMVGKNGDPLRDVNGRQRYRSQLVEQETGGRTQRTRSFDDSGTLQAASKKRRDGSMSQTWERSAAGKLLMVDFYTNRFRDVGFRSAIHGKIVKDKDGNLREEISQGKHRREISTLDDQGNRTLVSKKGRTYSWETKAFGDGKYALTRVSRMKGLYSSTYVVGEDGAKERLARRMFGIGSKYRGDLSSGELHRSDRGFGNGRSARLLADGKASAALGSDASVNKAVAARSPAAASFVVPDMESPQSGNSDKVTAKRNGAGVEEVQAEPRPVADDTKAGDGKSFKRLQDSSKAAALAAGKASPSVGEAALTKTPEVNTVDRFAMARARHREKTNSIGSEVGVKRLQTNAKPEAGGDRNGSNVDASGVNTDRFAAAKSRHQDKATATRRDDATKLLQPNALTQDSQGRSDTVTQSSKSVATGVGQDAFARAREWNTGSQNKAAEARGYELRVNELSR